MTDPILERYQKAQIALINALVEERAYNLRIKASIQLKPINGPVIDIAKAELRGEFKDYPEVEF